MKKASLFLAVIALLIIFLVGCPGKKETFVTLTMLEPVGEGNVQPAIGEHTYLVAPKKPAEAELFAEPAEGWEFERWEVDGEFYSSNTETALDMDADKDVQAFFKKTPVQEHVLTVDKVGEGTVEIDEEEAELPYEEDHVEGTEITLKAIPAEGWQFEKWVVDEEDVLDAETVITMDADVDAVAHFSQILPTEYTLSVDKVGEGTVQVDDEEAELPYEEDYTEGTEVALKALPAEGWQFEKWVINEEDVLDAETVVTMDADVDAVAHFSQIPSTEYTLSVDKVGEGTVQVDDEEAELPYEEDYVEGTEVALKAIPAEGWQFEKWVINEEDVLDAETFVTMGAGVDAVAHFSRVPPKQYTLTMLEPVGQGEVTPVPGVYIHVEDEGVTLLAEAADGWAFEKWVVNDEGFFIEDLTIQMNEDKEAQAFFVEIPPDHYTITFVYPGPGKGFAIRHPVGPTYEEGTEVLLTAFPDKCSEFKNWGGDASGIYFQTTVTMDEDKEVYVFFDRKTKPPLVDASAAPSSSNLRSWYPSDRSEEFPVLFTSAYSDADLIPPELPSYEGDFDVTFEWEYVYFDGPNGQATLVVNFNEGIDCEDILFTIFIEDACGNVGEEEVTIRVDNVAPRITFDVLDESETSIEEWYSERSIYYIPKRWINIWNSQDDICNGSLQASIEWEIEDNCLPTLGELIRYLGSVAAASFFEPLDAIPSIEEKKVALLVVVGNAAITLDETSQAITQHLISYYPNPFDDILDYILSIDIDPIVKADGLDGAISDLGDIGNARYYIVADTGNAEWYIEDLDCKEVGVMLFVIDRLGNFALELRAYVVDNMSPRITIVIPDLEPYFSLSAASIPEKEFIVETDVCNNVTEATFFWEVEETCLKEQVIIVIVGTYSSEEASFEGLRGFLQNPYSPNALDLLSDSLHGVAAFADQTFEIMSNNSDEEGILFFTSSSGFETWQLDGYDCGEIVVLIYAEDATGNDALEVRQYLVDNVAPVINDLEVEDFEFVGPDNEQIQAEVFWDVTDTCFEEVEITVTRGNVEGYEVVSLSSGPFTSDLRLGSALWTIDLDDLTTADAFELTLTAYDKCGNSAQDKVVVEVHELVIGVNTPDGGSTYPGVGTHFYPDNTELTLTAYPASGYEFVSWTEDDDIVSANENFTFEIADDRNLVANFEVEITELILYDGENAEDYDDDWVPGWSYGSGSQNKESDHLYLDAISPSGGPEYPGGRGHRTWVTDDSVSLEGFGFLKVDWENIGSDSWNNESYIVISTSKSAGAHDDAGVVLQARTYNFERTTQTIPISDVPDGTYYIRIHACASLSVLYRMSTIRVFRVWLE